MSKYIAAGIFSLAACCLIYNFGVVKIQGNSMQNTLHNGTFCLYKKPNLGKFNIRYNDLLLIRIDNSKNLIVKRCVGLPLDRINLLQNGYKTDDFYHPYVKTSIFKYQLDDQTGALLFEVDSLNVFRGRKSYYLFSTKNNYEKLAHKEEILTLDLFGINDTIICGSNEYYVLGDNLFSSMDSRFFGPIEKDKIEGIIVKIFKGSRYP